MTWQNSRRPRRLRPLRVAVLSGVVGSANLAAWSRKSDGRRHIDLRLSGG